jgi:plasmid stabilization system protein ParE
MKSGYNIAWTTNAINELNKTIQYLEQNFTDKEIKKLVAKIESVTTILTINPRIFPKSDSTEFYRVVILKYNTMYYRINNNTVEILSFFPNRRNPRLRTIL